MLVARRRITPETILRGPSTRQFWMRASNVPGVAHLLGECHACHNPASPNSQACTHCGASFSVEEDRQYLGLAEVRLIPEAGTRRTQSPAQSPARRDAPRPNAPAATAGVRPVGELVLDEPDAAPPASSQTAFEPVRNPARSVRTPDRLDDAQIDAMLRRGRADDRLKRSTGVVVALVVLALAGILGVGGYVVHVLTSGGAGPAVGGKSPAGQVPGN